MAERGDALAQLVHFVANAFARHELDAFVRRLPGGDRLALELPTPPASPVQAADGLVLALQRHGLLDREFFVALGRERPARRDEVELIMLGYLPGPKPRIQLGEGTELCNGRFVLEELSGSGGFGALWKARDVVLKESVAIKVLARDIPDKEYAWRRTMFIRGAKRMTGIRHAHVAQVLLPHVSEKGYDFCILEYIEGRSLHAEVKSKRLESVSEVSRVLLDVGAGLAEVHASGAIHGDVSPKNILVKRLDGRAHARLVDFDLVCSLEDELLTVAATGMPGTDPYAAPEWKMRLGKLDGRVDVFGLGMTAVYAFYGLPLPPSLNDSDAMDPARFIDRKLTCEPRIKEVLKQACSHEPAERHATMLEFCIALKRAITSRPPLLLRSEDAAEVRHEPKSSPEPSAVNEPQPQPPTHLQPQTQPPHPTTLAATTTDKVQGNDAAVDPQAPPPAQGLSTRSPLLWVTAFFFLSIVVLAAWPGRFACTASSKESGGGESVAQSLISDSAVIPASTDGTTSAEALIGIATEESATSETTGGTVLATTGTRDTKGTTQGSTSGESTPLGIHEPDVPDFTPKSALERRLESALKTCGSKFLEEVVKVEIVLGDSGVVSQVSLIEEATSPPIGVLDCVERKLRQLKLQNIRVRGARKFSLNIDLPVVE